MSVSKIYEEVEYDLAQDERRRHLPQYGSIRSSLYRERRKFVPRHPDTASELVLPEQWTQTLTDESFRAHIGFTERANSHRNTDYAERRGNSTSQVYCKCLYVLFCIYIVYIYCIIVIKLSKSMSDFSVVYLGTAITQKLFGELGKLSISAPPIKNKINWPVGNSPLKHPCDSD